MSEFPRNSDNHFKNYPRFEKDFQKKISLISSAYPLTAKIFDKLFRASFLNEELKRYKTKPLELFLIKVLRIISIMKVFFSKEKNRNDFFLLSLPSFLSLRENFTLLLKIKKIRILPWGYSQIYCGTFSQFLFQPYLISKPLFSINHLVNSLQENGIEQTSNNIQLLEDIEKKSKEHIDYLRMMIVKYSLKGVLSQGHTSISSASIALACDFESVPYVVISHGYIANRNLMTIAPISNIHSLLTWTEKQKRDIQEVINPIERNKIQCLGYPGSKVSISPIRQERSKYRAKVLFILEPIKKYIMKGIDSEIKSILNSINEFDLFIRAHPSDRDNYNYISKILDFDKVNFSSKSLANDLSRATMVIGTNSSVLFQSAANGIETYQIKELSETHFEYVNQAPFIEILEKLNDYSYSGKINAAPVNFLEDNLDSLFSFFE